jgi:hypothetical protein
MHVPACEKVTRLPPTMISTHMKTGERRTRI